MSAASCGCSRISKELAAADTVVASWREAGPAESYAAAREAKTAIGDGHPYATRKEASKASGHVRSILLSTLGKDQTEFTLTGVTGRSPKAVNAFGWALWPAAYVVPAVRAARTTKD